MASLRDVARLFRRLGDRVEQNTHNMVRIAALAVDRKLVFRTPVDTGQARSNWLVGINAPTRQTEGVESPGAAIARASATIRASKPGDTIYISNNLPYIGELNRGKSRQAPPGFVEQAANEAAAEAGESVKVL